MKRACALPILGRRLPVRLLSRGVRGDVYTHGHHASVVGQHSARTAENSAAFLLPHLTEGHRVLDVGCGPGSITVGLAQRVGPTGQITAIDNAEHMVQTTAQAAHTNGLDNVTCEVLSVYDLPYEPHSFDVVYAHQTLQHLSDPVAALVAMRRVVKPGGYMALRDADYSSMLAHPASPAIDEWRDVYRAVARRNGAEPDAGRQLVAWLLEAGVPLASVKYTAAAVTYAPGEEPWRSNWGNAWAERTRRSAFGKQAVEYGLATPAQLERMAQAWEEWAANPAALFYYVNGEALVRVPLESTAELGGASGEASGGTSGEPSYRIEPLISIPEVDVGEAARAIASGAARYIDCRSEGELGGGIVAGSVSLPFPHNGNAEVIEPAEFLLDVRAEGFERDHTIFVGCRSGARSALAAEVLIEAGYTDVRSVEGGILAWAAAGLPIEPFAG